MQSHSIKTPQVPVQPAAGSQVSTQQEAGVSPEENIFQKMFQAIDSNGDGNLDINEFTEFLDELLMQRMDDYTECGGHSGDGSGQGDAEAEKAALVAELGTKAGNKGLSPFETADADSTRILTGDVDGTMTNENIQKLVDRGYCVIIDGEMQATEKGKSLLDFMDTGKGIESQHIIHHIQDHEASLVGEMGNCSCEEGLTSFNTADENATRILLGDIDGQMNPQVIENMIRDGYFQVENGELQATDRGIDLLDYMQTSEKGFKGQHVVHHRADYEAMKVSEMGAKMSDAGFAAFDSADAGATRMLTGDVDGMMVSHNIQQLIDKEYLQVTNGVLETTPKGREFLDALDEQGIRTTHIVHHMQAYEAQLAA